MNFAPVLIPTLCRFDHFKRCMESLAKNVYAEKTEIYVALDYPFSDKHWEGYNKIFEYLSNYDNIKNFKAVHLIKREKNFGAYINGESARLELLNKFDEIIFTEDDNEFAPNFLAYINKGLEKFRNNSQVVAICGYAHDYTTQIPFSDNYFFSHRFDAWGIGIWKHKGYKNRVSSEVLEDFIKKKENLNLLKKYCKPQTFYYFKVLWGIIKKYDIEHDQAVYLSNIIHGTYTVFPKVSKCKNHGFDGTGGLTNKRKYQRKFEAKILNRQIDSSLSFEFVGNDLHDDSFTYFNTYNLQMNFKLFVKLIYIKFYFFLRYRKFV